MTGVDADRVRITMDDGVAVVTLARPDKHNALDEAMIDSISAAAVRLGDDASVRAVVLHGEGPSFCSGLDLERLRRKAVNPSALVDAPDPLGNWAQRAARGWSVLPVPVIAAVHGNCLGGGAQLALGADLRLAAPDARISILEIAWGLVPDMGLTHHLPRLVPFDVAFELTVTGRILSGTEAAQLGLVTRTTPDPLQESLRLAREIAGKSPDAIRAAKRLLHDTWNRNDPSAVLLREATLQQRLIRQPNQIAAVAAGMAGEPARFADPTVDLT
jgi:enoyl-CoA hydratase/carnithine racemase